MMNASKSKVVLDVFGTMYSLGFRLTHFKVLSIIAQLKIDMIKLKRLLYLFCTFLPVMLFGVVRSHSVALNHIIPTIIIV